jgi:hypothetical protein
MTLSTLSKATMCPRTVRRACQGLAVALAAFAWPGQAGGQPLAASASGLAETRDSYAPITAKQRLEWSADAVLGRPAVVGAIASAVWQTAWNTPPEWRRTWRGAGLRLAQREADAALSTGIEAGLGSLWSEDPRYVRSGHGAIVRRLGYAARSVFVAPRKNGTMAPAWARYAGNTVNNVVENAWLPPSQRTWQKTMIRSGNSILARLSANLWSEFRADLIGLWSHRKSPPTVP